jgi:hypothetical protein
LVPVAQCWLIDIALNGEIPGDCRYGDSPAAGCLLCTLQLLQGYFTCC